MRLETGTVHSDGAAALPKYLILLVALFGFAASPAAGADLTLSAESSYIIEAQVNGQPVRLRVDPGAPG